MAFSRRQIRDSFSKSVDISNLKAEVTNLLNKREELKKSTDEYRIKELQRLSDEYMESGIFEKIIDLRDICYSLEISPDYTVYENNSRFLLRFSGKSDNTLDEFVYVTGDEVVRMYIDFRSYNKILFIEDYGIDSRIKILRLVFENIGEYIKDTILRINTAKNIVIKDIENLEKK